MKTRNCCVVAVFKANSRWRHWPLDTISSEYHFSKNKMLYVAHLGLTSPDFLSVFCQLTCWTLCLAVDSLMHRSCFLQFSNWQEPEVERDRTGLNVQHLQQHESQSNTTRPQNRLHTTTGTHLCKRRYNHVVTMTEREKKGDVKGDFLI